MIKFNNELKLHNNNKKKVFKNQNIKAVTDDQMSRTDSDINTVKSHLTNTIPFS